MKSFSLLARRAGTGLLLVLWGIIKVAAASLADLAFRGEDRFALDKLFFKR
ncbi:MAG TPA: hypothetical protein VNH64_03380 [Parvularculaceae bacterium]|nr:hypothetical protein [Parvularculaceae bacterium]